MRPIKLIIEGFTSFRNRQELDFTNLDLFAITGDTGAGKSSLLDAITYALYEKVARLKGTKGDHGKDLISQGSQSLKVELTFAIQNTEYKVIRTWEKRTKTVKKTCLLDKFNNGIWERIDESIESILKMDFDTFTRVIFLPQGQFDNFLKGEARKRREILRSLAGLEIFEKMRSKASENAKEYETQLAKIKGQLEGINAPSELELKEKQSQLDNINLQLPQLQQEKDNAQKLFDDETRLFEQIKRLSTLETELNQILQQQENINQLSQELELIKKAILILGDWEQKEAIFKQVQDLEKDLKVKESALTLAQSELEKMEEIKQQFKATEKEIKQQFEQRKASLTTAKFYLEQWKNKQQELEQLKATLKEKEQENIKANQELESANEKMIEVNQQLAEVNNILTQSQVGGERLEHLTQIVTFLLPQWQNFEQETNQRLQKIKQISQNKENLEQEKESILAKIEAQKNQLELAEKALESAKNENNQIIQHNHVQAIKSTLNHGDNCPVCGGIVDENYQSALTIDHEIIDLTPLEISVKKETKNNQDLINQKTKLETEFNSLVKQETDLQAELKNYQPKLQEIQLQISNILGEESWKAENLQQEYQEVKVEDEKYQQALTKQKEIKIELDKLQQALDFAQKTVETTIKELEKAQASQLSCQEEYDNLLKQLEELTHGLSYAKLEKTLNQEIEEFEKKQTNIEKKYQDALNNKVKAQSDYDSSKNNLKQALERQENLLKKWQSQLEKLSLTETDFVKAKTNFTYQQQWEKNINEFNNQKLDLESRIKQVKEDIGERNTDENILKQLEETKQKKLKLFDETKKEQIEIETWLNDATKQQAKALELFKEETKINEKVETYKQLSQDLQSDRFQSYILEHLEKELVERANIILTDLTDSRYTLNINNNEYQVADNWNGGETRHIRTLSGGETFATSLSMALALSEKLSMGVELGSLFLDEGFGTLDQETLEIVTQVLESLRQQDRLIGVITHIPALAEKLATQIKVHKSPAGSRLIVETF